MFKVLVVEDEESIREVEVAYLKRAGFQVFEADNGKTGMDIFKNNNIDLVVLDLNLPEMNGLDFCKQIRDVGNTPIVMVTARVSEIEEIIGFEYGADDYIKKPFSGNILVARVRNLLKYKDKQILKFGNLEIDPGKITVKKDGKSVNLTSTQFNILYTLANDPGMVFSRESIISNSYNDSVSPDILDRTIDAHIKSIRGKIEDDSSKPKYILTVIGKGYKANENI